MKRHLWQVHSEGNGNYFECKEDGCNLRFKSNSNLKSHLWSVHSKGDGKYFYCTEIGCEYRCKRNDDLKKHICFVHNKGNKLCDYCAKKFYKTYSFEDKNASTVHICKTCHNTATGKKIRVEHQLVHYLEKTELKDFIISKDKIIKHNNCETKRRPDVIISVDVDFQIIIECDEDGHNDHNETCETGRMNEIMDEFDDSRVVFIRWNPNNFYIGEVRQKINFQDKLDLLLKLIRKLCLQRTTMDDNTIIYYMFYNDFSHLFSKSLPNKKIFSEDDI